MAHDEAENRRRALVDAGVAGYESCADDDTDVDAETLRICEQQKYIAKSCEQGRLVSLIADRPFEIDYVYSLAGNDVTKIEAVRESAFADAMRVVEIGWKNSYKS